MTQINPSLGTEKNNFWFHGMPRSLQRQFRLRSCAGPGIFVRGSRSVWQKKALTTFFLVLSLFYRSQMVNFIEIYHFSRFQRGSNIFQGGPTFSRGVQLLIPYRNPYNLWFSRGGPDPLSPPPSGSALGDQTVIVTQYKETQTCKTTIYIQERTQ